METEEGIDPSEVNRSPELIKGNEAAQEDIGKLHVLVCGRCHRVSHFIEEFVEHQQPGKCAGISSLPNNHDSEPKPQVWAFMLWKNAQIKTEQNRTHPITPWSVYQNWCNLEPERKDAWIRAGQNLLSFSKINAAKIQEIKNKVQAALKVGRPAAIAKPILRGGLIKAEADESLEEGEISLTQLSNVQRTAVKARIATNRIGDQGADSEEEEDVDKHHKTSTTKKAPFKPVQISSDNVMIPLTRRPSELRKALRTGKDESTEEATVEKLVNRRFNQKKRYFEYLVKWEDSNDSENTWEPKMHFDKCKTFIEEFDKAFNKAKLTPKLAPKRVDTDQREVEQTPGGRPQRTSKQRALNQVKVWCGDITEGEESPGKRKSPSEDGDSSDSFEKKIKLEEDTDSSEDEKPSITIKKIVKGPNSVNGVANKRSGDVTPGLGAQRVVRVNQRQLPSLSSGVYIMSKHDGIVKLDSNAGTGGPIFKVCPKIGDTHIKMVKKDTPNAKGMAKPGLKPLKMLSSPNQLPNKTPVIQQRKIAASARASSTPKHTAAGAVSSDRAPSWVDEDSDGLEEMEFPTDVPVAQPESPPGEFILCPLTGKMLGATNEPESASQPAAAAAMGGAVDALDNLVQLAVANLPDEAALSQGDKADDKTKISIKTEDSGAAATAILPPQKVVGSEAPAKSVLAENPPGTSGKSLKIGAPAATDVSILNAALTATKTALPIRPSPPSPTQAQKKLLSAPNTVQRQKVTTITRLPPSPGGRPSLSMPAPNTTIIHKISPNKPRPLAPKPAPPSEQPVLKRSPNVTTYKPAANVTRRIGNTTIYKSSERSTATPKTAPPSHSTAAAVVVSAAAAAAADAVVQPTASPTVINMPLLATEENQAPSSSSGVPGADETAEQAPSNAPLTETALADLSTFSLASSETPLLITGEDGTIYQVAGQNEDGQTILISEGPDGQQQCVIVSSDSTVEADAPALMMDTSEVAESSVQQPQQQEQEAENTEESQVVAQIIKADPPSPGGTRKVVLMLPDGNLMMTDVTAEQYDALELDK